MLLNILQWFKGLFSLHSLYIGALVALVILWLIVYWHKMEEKP